MSPPEAERRPVDKGGAQNDLMVGGSLTTVAEPPDIPPQRHSPMLRVLGQVVIDLGRYADDLGMIAGSGARAALSDVEWVDPDLRVVIDLGGATALGLGVLEAAANAAGSYRETFPPEAAGDPWSSGRSITERRPLDRPRHVLVTGRNADLVAKVVHALGGES